MKISKYLFLFGIILFAFVVWNVGPFQIIDSFVNANPFYLALAVLMLIPVLILKAVKFDLLLNAFDVKYGTLKALKVWCIGFFLGMVSPGRAGDFLRSIYVNRDTKLALGKSLTSVVMERIIDLTLLFIAGFAGLIIFSFYFDLQGSFLVLISLFLLFFVAMIFLLTRKKLVSLVLRPIFRKFVPEKYKSKFQLSFHDFYDGLAVYRTKKSLLLKVLLLAVLMWAINFIEIYFLVLAFDIQISIFFLSIILPAILLIEILPISFSGLGTREATVIFFLSFKAVSPEVAVSFSLSILFLNFITAGMGAAFLKMRKD